MTELNERDKMEVVVRNKTFQDIVTEYDQETSEIRKAKLGALLNRMDKTMVGPIDNAFQKIVEKLDKGVVNETAAMDGLSGDITRPMYEQITLYGTAPAAKIGQVADKLIDQQATFDKSILVFKQQSKMLKEGKARFEELREQASTGEVVKEKIEGIFKFFSGLASLFGKKKEKAPEPLSEDEQLMQDNQERLNDMRTFAKNLAEDLKDAEKGMNVVIAQINTMAREHVLALDECNIYICAGHEVMRLFDEEYKPKVGEYQSNLGRYIADQTEMMRGEMMARMANLQQQETLSQNATARMSAMREAALKQQRLMRSMRESYIPQWTADLQMAGLAASLHRNIHNMQENSDMADETLRSSVDTLRRMLEATGQQAGRPGAYSLEAVQDVVEGTKQVLEENAERQNRVLEELNTAFVEMQEASNSIIEVAERIRKERTLADFGTGAGANKTATPDVSNDNAGEATPKPEAEQKPAPAARRRFGK